jgi:hypothetical protein
MEDTMTSNDLKAWRAPLALTQIQAAELLGVDDRTYQRFEHGTIFRTKLPGYVAAATYGAAIALGQARRVLSASGFNPEKVHAKWLHMNRENVNSFAERNLAHRILRLHAIPRGPYIPVPRQGPIVISASVPEFEPQDVAGLAACPSARR